MARGGIDAITRDFFDGRQRLKLARCNTLEFFCSRPHTRIDIAFERSHLCFRAVSLICVA